MEATDRNGQRNPQQRTGENRQAQCHEVGVLGRMGHVAQALRHPFDSRG